MKSFNIIAILLLSSVMFFYSCNDSSKTEKQDNSKSIEVVEPSTNSTTVTPAATTAEPAQNTSGVWHYTCRIGCPGGAGTASKCTNCGNILVHNTAYHGTTSTTSTSPFADPSSTPAATPPPVAEPAQNAAGVWHYTCTKGCAGGAGAAGNCATCSSPLAHNSAYH
jgi:4-aminobutyrate aminotransferase-like enzyme